MTDDIEREVDDEDPIDEVPDVPNDPVEEGEE